MAEMWRRAICRYEKLGQETDNNSEKVCNGFAGDYFMFVLLGGI